MTRPTAWSEWWWSVIWSGVIVMIRTMTNWPTTSATIASATVGRRMMADIGAATSESMPDTSVRSASSYGSGRRNTNDDRLASATSTIGTRYGPASAGRPIDT